MVIKPTEIAGGEHWGGANDSKWHGPPQRVVLSLTKESDAKGKQPVLELAEIRADALLPVFVQPPAYKEDFDKVVILLIYQQFSDSLYLTKKQRFGEGLFYFRLNEPRHRASAVKPVKAALCQPRACLSR